MYPDPSDRTTAAITAQLHHEGCLPEDAFIESWVVVAAWRTADNEGVSWIPSIGADPTEQAVMIRSAQSAMEARP